MSYKANAPDLLPENGNLQPLLHNTACMGSSTAMFTMYSYMLSLHCHSPDWTRSNHGPTAICSHALGNTISCMKTADVRRQLISIKWPPSFS